MDNDGKLTGKQQTYPMPPGGREPSPSGDPKSMGQGSSANVGYDYLGSMPGTTSADLMRGYCPRGRIDGNSDAPSEV